ncbi:MAG: LacI family DNA-binding transcriptional regulator [Eubacteriales bacterium]|nr:LacI family DNA-binding transcriptional regulator [Eubacteriales bacterium]
MSLKKIAMMTGASVSTVSRVLGSPDYHCSDPELEQKIREAAQEIQYLPNRAARSLRRQEEQSEETLTADIFLARFASLDSDLFFRELYNCIQAELRLQNCLAGEILQAEDVSMLQSVHHGGHVPYRTAQKQQEEQRVRGNAAVPTKEGCGLLILGKCPEKTAAILKQRYRFLVGIDRNPTDYLYDEVVCDGAAAAQKAVEYLISLGHREIIYIGDCTYESRYIGYYQALLAHRMPLNYSDVFPTGQTEEEGYRVMQQLLESGRRPEAVFCANDSTAFGVLEALRQKKIRGWRPSVISIDNTDRAAKSVPALTAIDMPKKEMAHLAVQLLLDQFHRGHKEHVRLQLPCRLVVRESTGNIQL